MVKPISNEANPKQIKLQQLRRLSDLLDNAIAIPGTEYRVGLDPLIGLLPGGGDMLTAFLSAYIVWEAAQMGLPQATLLRMFWHIIVDTLLGAVPVLGDIFDIAWKANVKNITLIESHLASPHTSQKADKLFIILLLIGLIGFVGLVSFFAVAFIQILLNIITGQ